VAVPQGIAQLLDGFERGVAPDLGVGAGAQPLGDVVAELDAGFRLRDLERLGVGVRAMNLTPCRPERIMLLMALPPAPPTPITLILADFSRSTYVNIKALPPALLSRAKVAL
jgi:hypothetical protein